MNIYAPLPSRTVAKLNETGDDWEARFIDAARTTLVQSARPCNQFTEGDPCHCCRTAPATKRVSVYGPRGPITFAYGWTCEACIDTYARRIS